MKPNPYSPPQADVQLHQPTPVVPAAIAKKIKSAWIAGLISAAMTLLVVLVGVAGFNVWNLLDVALILALAFGIYKRSRTCAVMLLVYFAVSKIITVAETGKATGIVLGLVFIYYYGQGVVGTFAYHRHVKSQQR